MELNGSECMKCWKVLEATCKSIRLQIGGIDEEGYGESDKVAPESDFT